jgi:hypothetical protein
MLLEFGLPEQAFHGCWLFHSWAKFHIGSQGGV